MGGTISHGSEGRSAGAAARDVFQDISGLMRETQAFAAWTIADVKELHRRFQRMVFGYSLVEPQLECVLAFKKGLEADLGVPLSALFRALDNDCDGRIDGLELMGGLALCCHGTFEDKVRFCFELHDFNLNASLSRAEVALMMQSSVCGALCLAGSRREPPLEHFEALAGEAFARADLDGSGCVCFSEFLQWARSNRDIMACMERLSAVAAAADPDAGNESEDSAPGGCDEGCSDIEEELRSEAPAAATPSGSTGRDGAAAAAAVVEASTEPTHWVAREGAADAPSTNLHLDWVHGFNCADCRNQVRYVAGTGGGGGGGGGGSAKESVVLYPAATVAVLYSPRSHTQRYYQGHAGTVVSVAVHPGGGLVATGERAPPSSHNRGPEIHVWSTDTLQCKAVLSGFHRGAVALLAFSPDGTLLASLGTDPDHSVALYDWAAAAASGDVSRALVATGKGHRRRTLGLAFAADGRSLCAVGVGFVRFFAREGHCLEGRSARITRGPAGTPRGEHHGKPAAPGLGRLQTFLSVAYVGADAVVGCASGELYRFRGLQLVQVVQAHGLGDAVSALAPYPPTGGLVTGGRDGLVVTWDASLKPVGDPLDLSADVDSDGKADCGALNPAVVSVHGDGDKLVVATRSGDIFECVVGPAARVTRLATAHCSWQGRGRIARNAVPASATASTAEAVAGGIAAVAAHPSRVEFATVGSDRTLRVWSARRRQQVALRELPAPGTAAAYAPSGDALAVGLGNGTVAILQAKDVTRLTCAWQHVQQAVTALSFSPDGKVLAAGAADGNIYLYSTGNDSEDAPPPPPNAAYARRAMCHGERAAAAAAAAVVAVDWSFDSRHMRSSHGDGQLCFWDSWGVQVHALSLLRDAHWATCTCAGAWPVRAVNFNKRQTPAVLDRDPAYRSVLAGDARGRLALARYPCVVDGALSQEYHGHSGSVAAVRFSWDGRYVITVGADDRCVLQWRHELEDGAEDSDSDSADGAAANANGHNESAPIATAVTAVAAASAAAAVQPAPPDLLVESSLKGPSTGDEFMAVKPWMGAIVEPTWWRGSGDAARGATDTDVDLELRWVHGYRGADCRNNAAYTADGDVAYHAAAVGIVYRKGKGTQSLLRGAHTDDITCLALHPNGRIIATGQIGKKPKLVVWDADSCDVLAQLQLSYNGGIGCLAFAPPSQGGGDGGVVFSVGLDADHTLCVHDWRQKRLLASAPSDKGKVLGLCVTPGLNAAGDTVVTCGDGHIKFWTRSGPNLASQRAVWSKACAKQTMLVVQAVPATTSVCLSGASDGSLCLWQGYALQAAWRHHAAGISALGVLPPPPGKTGGAPANGSARSRVLSGDAAGAVITWDCVVTGGSGKAAGVQLQPTHAFSAAAIAPRAPLRVGVRALHVCGGRLLVGTAGCELFEVSLATLPAFSASTAGAPAAPIEGVLLAAGHCGGEAWGLATHPLRQEYATCGDDSTLRLWTVGGKVEAACYALPAKARALSYLPPEGALLAVALVTGTIQVLHVAAVRSGRATEALQSELQDPKQWCQCIRYSPDGRFLAVGSHDRNVYLYAVGGAGDAAVHTLRATLTGHSSYITGIDFGYSIAAGAAAGTSDLETVASAATDTSKVWLQSTCGAYELLYHDCNTGQRQPSAAKLRDVQWCTWTCPLGWPVQGIWPSGSDGTDINSVDRSHTYGAVPVVACGDDSGNVRLLNYPCTAKGAPAKAYSGHSSHVTSVRFTADDAHLISVGGGDRCVFVWATDCAEEARARQAARGLHQDDDVTQAQTERSTGHAAEEGDFASDLLVGNGGSAPPPAAHAGDEFMAVKPWLGAIREPSGWKEGPDVAEAPAAELLLSFVYGYQAQQARSNLCYGATTDDIIFHAAAVGVRHSIAAHRQTFNLEHTDDITCLAVHPKGHVVATGALGKQPKVIVWDAQTGATLKVLSGLHKRGIACLAFSASGAILATTGLDDDHTLAVYGVTDGALLVSTRVDKQQVLCCAFAGETDVAVGGKSFVKFLTLPAGGRGDVQSKKGIFGKLGTSTTAMSCAWVGAHAVTGMADGSLYLWKDRCCTATRAAHKGGVNSMCRLDSLDEGLRSGAGALVTGGRDGRVLIWDDQLQQTHAFDLSTATGVDAPLKAEVRSIATKGGKILVGTGGSDVMEIAIASGTARKLLQAHYQGEMWGLAPHPLLPCVATACADGTIRVWDATARALVHCRSVSGEVHGLAFSPGGKHLAAGMTSGDVLVLTEDLSQVVATVKIGAAAIECLAYSPDGLTLAVGAHDACVHLLAATAGYARRAVCRGHSSYVRHLDFSADSRYFKSNCGAYELLFWEVAKATQVKSATAVRNVKWHTCTCTLGWPVQGIHKPGADGTDVNGVDYHRDLQLLATADDFGHVNLFRYPCVVKGAKAKTYGGHASHVTRVAFCPSGGYLFSAGGNDRALLQWEVKGGL